MNAQDLIASFGVPVYAQGFALFAIYVAAGLAALFAGTKLYTKFTPYDEFELIKKGNAAAAIALLGEMVGWALSLGACFIFGSSLVDALIWASLALGVQMLAYKIAGFFLKGIRDEIVAGNIAAGIYLGGVSLAVGILCAAAITP